MLSVVFFIVSAADSCLALRLTLNASVKTTEGLWWVMEKEVAQEGQA